MTKVVINRLQNYYGIATRPTLFHVASSEKNNYHSAYCPTGKDSWCRFQQDRANGTKTYKPGRGLPLSVIEKVKPIFAALSSEELLAS